MPPKPQSDVVQVKIPKEDQKITFTIDHRAFVIAIKNKIENSRDREVLKLKKISAGKKWSQTDLQMRVSCVTMLSDFTQKMLIGKLKTENIKNLKVKTATKKETNTIKCLLTKVYT